MPIEYRSQNSKQINFFGALISYVLCKCGCQDIHGRLKFCDLFANVGIFRELRGISAFLCSSRPSDMFNKLTATITLTFASSVDGSAIICDLSWPGAVWLGTGSGTGHYRCNSMPSLRLSTLLPGQFRFNLAAN